MKRLLEEIKVVIGCTLKYIQGIKIEKHFVVNLPLQLTGLQQTEYLPQKSQPRQWIWELMGEEIVQRDTTRPIGNELGWTILISGDECCFCFCALGGWGHI